MKNEIRKEAKAYAFRNDGCGYDLNTCEDIFSDGAEWADNTMLEKACEWLEDNYPYWFDTDMKEQFIKAMKGDEK